MRAYLNNEDDMYRCHAYAQAILGRPYRGYFVRPRRSWDGAFARGVATDPDETPMVTPAAPLVPYRDFLLEYPPGFLLILLPPALVASTADGYALGFKVEMATFLVVCLLGARRLLRAQGGDADARGRLAGAFAASVFALGVVCTHRFDAFVAACTVVGIVAAVSGRSLAAGAAIGLAVATKGVPGLVVPALLTYVHAQRGGAAARRLSLGLLVVAGGLLGGAWLIGGDGLVEAFAYHRDRPIQIESTAGALLELGNAIRPGLVTVVHSFSSRNLRGPIVGPAGAVSLAVTSLALVILTIGSVRRIRAALTPEARLTATVDAAVVVLAAYATLGKVFCPQYIVWFLPFALVAAFASGRSARRRGVGLGVLAATQIIYPISYEALKAMAPAAALLVLARNLITLGWAVTLLCPRSCCTGSIASVEAGAKT